MREVVFIEGYNARFTDNGAEYKARVNKQYQYVPVEQQKGWFHGFFQEGCEGDGLNPVAVIEDTEGYVRTVGMHCIKFVHPGRPANNGMEKTLKNAG